MKTNRFSLLLFLFFSFLVNQGNAQDEKSMLLVDYLRILENRFDVVFTYADENVVDIEVIIPGAKINLAESLKSIENQTNLTLEKLSPRYIAIQKKSPDEMVTIIKGTVIDKNTREPLPGAVVHSVTNYTLTGEDGHFSLQVHYPKDSLLVVRYAGYMKRVFKLNELKTDSWVILLTPGVLAIDEVVINYIVPGISKLTTGAFQINLKALEIMPGLSEPDVLQTLQVLPGVMSVNETVSYINTRGGTNDQNLVLWEGVKMYHTSHFFGLISGINPQLIHKTIFMKNGTTAALDEGVSGTIYMKQQDHHVNKLKFDAGSNLLSADAIVLIPVKKNLSLHLGARHSISNFFLSPTYKNYYKRAFEHAGVAGSGVNNDSVVKKYHDFSFYDWSIKFLYDISAKDKIRLGFLNINNTIQYDESSLINDSLLEKTSRLAQSSLLSNFKYTREWNQKHSTTLTSYFSNYLLDGVNARVANQQAHFQKNSVLDWGLKLHSTHAMNSNIKLYNGYQFDEIGIRNRDNINKPNYQRDVKDVLRLHAVYSEAEFGKLLESLSARVGVRAIYLGKFNDLKIEPRFALRYSLNDYLSFELLAEGKSQYTTQLVDYQTDFLGIEKRRWVLSNNSTIPIIESRQLSTGLHYNRDKFLFSFEVYKKKVEGIISPSQGFLNQFQQQYAIGEYETEGFEFLLNNHFNKINGWLTYSLSWNNYYFQDFTPSSFPNNLDIRHVITFGGSYHLKRFMFSGGGNYRTGKPFTKPLEDVLSNTGEIVYEQPNSSHLDDFIRFDLSMKYTFNIKELKALIGLSVWNLLDRDNELNRYYYVNEENEVERVTQYSMDFTPNLSLRVSF